MNLNLKGEKDILSEKLEHEENLHQKIAMETNPENKLKLLKEQSSVLDEIERLIGMLTNSR